MPAQMYTNHLSSQAPSNYGTTYNLQESTAQPYHNLDKHCNPHQHPVGAGQHLTLTSIIQLQYYTNTPTSGRRGATLSATYLGGHLTFTSIIQHQYTNTPTFGRRGAILSATYLGGHLTFTSIIQLQYQHTTHSVGVGLHYQLPIWVDTSRLLASYNYNTNTPHSR